MQSQDYLVQLIFYYTNGHTETFTITPSSESGNPEESMLQIIRQYLSQKWCIIHTPDNSVCINMANILKVEINPPLFPLQGEDVVPQAERLTPLTRGSRVL